MLVLQILILLFFMVVIPMAMGAGIACFTEKQERNICFIWVAGFSMFMALFQLVAVPVILVQEKVDFGSYGALTVLVWLFGTMAVLIASGSMAIWVRRMRRMPRLQVVGVKMLKQEKILWTIFGALLFLQLVMAAVLFFGDGDDAFYVTAATLSQANDNMYINLPYTGGTTGLDARHSLAPFPILIAFLARVTGLHAATMAHVVFPMFVIPLTYCTYGLIGNRLFKGKRNHVAIFMIFVEILVLWGNHSPYTAETFLMIRSWQGKAVLANVVLPATFLVVYMICERLNENRKVERSLFVLLFLLAGSAALCSTQGCILTVALVGCFGICTAVVYKAFRVLLPLGLCMIPAAIYMGMYLWIR